MSITDPTATIHTASDAVFCAATLMRETALMYPGFALRDPHGIWRSHAEAPLASLLYAASPAGCGGGMGWAALALDNTDPEPAAAPGWWQVAHLCSDHPLLAAAAVRATDDDDRQRHLMLLLLHDVVDYLTDGGPGRASPLTPVH